MSQVQHLAVDKLTAKTLVTVGETNGVKFGSTVVALENSPGVHKTVLTLTATPTTIALATTVSAGGGTKIYTFPAGHIAILGASSNLTNANAVNASWLASLGTVAADTSTTLSSTEANIAPSVAATTSAGVGTAKHRSSAIAMVDGSVTPVDVYLNYALNADGTGGTAMTTSGTVTIYWMNLGT